MFSRGLKSAAVAGKGAPTYLPVANRAARKLAEVTGGIPLNLLTESIGNTATTAHILIGCHMGDSVADGVIDTDHKVFGYPGLYVVDGCCGIGEYRGKPEPDDRRHGRAGYGKIPPKPKTVSEKRTTGEDR